MRLRRGCVILIFDKKIKEENEKNLMQSEDNDDGGLAPGKEADDAMRKLFRFLLKAFIKD